jgi:hypothetical protein
VQLLPNANIKLVLADAEDQYEIIILLDNPTLALNQHNHPEGYKMNDLLQREKCIPDGRVCYSVLGRVDDIIIHARSEKTQPLPLEEKIKQYCHAVEACIIGGNNRFHTYCVVELKEGYQPTDATVQVELYKAVERANEDAPVHSRVAKEMCYIIPAGDKLPRTDKGNVKRKFTESKYKLIIDQLYSNFSGPVKRQRQSNSHDMM